MLKFISLCQLPLKMSERGGGVFVSLARFAGVFCHA